MIPSFVSLHPSRPPSPQALRHARRWRVRLAVEHAGPQTIALYLYADLHYADPRRRSLGRLTPPTGSARGCGTWVYQHTVVDDHGPEIRPPAADEEAPWLIRMQEVLCFLFICFFAVRMTMSYGLLFKEALSPWLLVQIYLTGVFIVGTQRIADAGLSPLDEPRRPR